MDLANHEIDRPEPKQPRKAKDLGKLNNLLIRGLPDWLDDDGILRTYDLAKYLGISYQALYKTYTRERMPSRRIPALIKLSAESKTRPEGFRELTFEDFVEFM